MKCPGRHALSHQEIPDERFFYLSLPQIARMKRLILVAALFFLMNSVSYAQMTMLDKKTEPVTVGKVSISGILRTQLTYELSPDTVYKWIYRNEDSGVNNVYKFISFSGKGNAKELLYTTLKDFWSRENKKKATKEVRKTFKLGEVEVTVENQRMFGRTQVFVHTPDGSFALYEKDIDPLFGKDR